MQDSTFSFHDNLMSDILVRICENVNDFCLKHQQMPFGRADGAVGGG